jgi:hypothetical protein
MKNRVMLAALFLAIGTFATQALAFDGAELLDGGRVVCDSHGTNCCVIFADGSAQC